MVLVPCLYLFNSFGLKGDVAGHWLSDNEHLNPCNVTDPAVQGLFVVGRWSFRGGFEVRERCVTGFGGPGSGCWGR